MSTASTSVSKTESSGSNPGHSAIFSNNAMTEEDLYIANEISSYIPGVDNIYPKLKIEDFE